MGLEPTPPLKGQESESCASAIPPLPQSYLTYLLYNIVFIQSTKILKVININLWNTKSVWVVLQMQAMNRKVCTMKKPRQSQIVSKKQISGYEKVLNTVNRIL